MINVCTINEVQVICYLLHSVAKFSLCNVLIIYISITFCTISINGTIKSKRQERTTTFHYFFKMNLVLEKNHSLNYFL